MLLCCELICDAFGTITTTVNKGDRKNEEISSARIRFDSVAVGAGYSYPSHAQGADRVLEEIVVTARKREESLQDVPVVVSALSAGMIDRYNLDTLVDVAGLIPDSGW